MYSLEVVASILSNDSFRNCQPSQVIVLALAKAVAAAAAALGGSRSGKWRRDLRQDLSVLKQLLYAGHAFTLPLPNFSSHWKIELAQMHLCTFKDRIFFNNHVD